MAELADAHGSGPCDSNIMRVQVPSSARRLKSKDLSLFVYKQFYPLPNNGCYIFTASAAPASPPPVPSVGEAPGLDRLIPGAGFLLACRRMRWRAADTCLSAASCVRGSPSLAFFCGLRGTLPESRSVQARSLSGAHLPPL